MRAVRTGPNSSSRSTLTTNSTPQRYLCSSNAGVPTFASKRCKPAHAITTTSIWCHNKKCKHKMALRFAPAINTSRVSTQCGTQQKTKKIPCQPFVPSPRMPPAQRPSALILADPLSGVSPCFRPHPSLAVPPMPPFARPLTKPLKWNSASLSRRDLRPSPQPPLFRRRRCR